MNDSTATLPPHVQLAELAAEGGHYSHAVVADGFALVSGQLPTTADGTKLVDATFADQAKQALDNVPIAGNRCSSLSHPG